MKNDLVNHPKHYVDQGIVIEPIFFCERLPFCHGNALKYCFRAGKKEGASELLDLRKAWWYLNRIGMAPFGYFIADRQNFYSLSRALIDSKNPILREAAIKATGYDDFWTRLKNKVEERIVQLEKESTDDHMADQG